MEQKRKSGNLMTIYDIDVIITVACTFYGVDRCDMLNGSASKMRECRMFAMYIIYEDGMSAKQVSEIFGKTIRSVRRNVRNARNAVCTYNNYADVVKKIREKSSA